MVQENQEIFIYKIMKIVKALLITILILFFLTVMFLLSECSPKAPVEDISKPNKPVSRAVLTALVEKSVALEDEYNKRVAINEPVDDDILLVERAIESLEEYMSTNPRPDRTQYQRLRNLIIVSQTYNSKKLSIKIDALEAQAKEAQEAGNFDDAKRIFQDAINVQSELNMKYPQSKYSSVLRYTELTRTMRTIEAKPLYESSLAAENEALQAMADEKWDLAKEKFNEAIETQRKMNQEFPDVKTLSYLRIKKLETQYDSLRSSNMNDDIESKIVDALKAEADSEFIKAADLYHDVIDIQYKLNREYPQSRFAVGADSKIKKWELAREKNISMKDGVVILNDFKKLNEWLLNKEYDKVEESINAILQSAERFKVDYPNSNIVTDDKLLELRYINYVKSEIKNIHKLVYDSLHEKLFDDKWLLLKTEVTQKLYTTVMQDNPSRNADSEDNPVEFITYEEAQRFCTRLAWIFAKDVSLPTAKIMNDAIGDMRYVDLNAISWHMHNSFGKTQIVATKRPNDIGFFDLLGNVAEYVNSSGSKTGMVDMMGGSVQDSTDEIIKIPTISGEKNQRSRAVGFRILVEK